MRYHVLTEWLDTAMPPEQIFHGLFAGAPHAFWLDSSRPDPRTARFSFMGDDRGPLSHALRYRRGGRSEWTGAPPRAIEGDVFQILDTRLQQSELVGDPALPFDFCGGYVGYFGYELMAETQNVPAHDTPLPDAHFLFADRFLAYDHHLGRIHLVCLHTGDAEPAHQWLRDTANRLRHLPPVTLAPLPPSAEEVRMETWLNDSKAAYLDKIRRCKRAIADGESYEICLTTKLTMPLSETFAPLDAYLRLRRVNPAPYACFLRTPDYAVLCSSPECFLRIDQNGYVRARPIKGTLPRSDDPQTDRAHIDALKTDPRFFSENLMIVDLLRNDLARSCEPGSIEVPGLMEVESYATVHQLVSTIRGKLAGTPIECVRHCFPGGSMTGAPKKRTLEILAQLETTPRGIYSGAIGYLSLNRTADLNIVIRTLVCHSGQAELGVGGAITQLSDPEAEYEEVLLKARAPFSVIAPGLSSSG
ncbi:anthranilate synthase component I family protein [Paludibacterium paludis]|uniref:Aminodeoxychorismate synthase n=1 Tax=Paludibacterium paludis TaxID=1225769 RepID=A0A918P214_9NEIS|nr:anthranilate synthase component I family protein [Paludibacterium paludis]GGY14662.1 hypothetical protein GCM10011289_17500 [Paludibacterium paludis]